MTLTKADLAEHLFEELGLNKPGEKLKARAQADTGTQVGVSSDDAV